MPVELTVEGFCVGVYEQFVGVTTVAICGVVGAVDTVAIALAWLNPGNIAVPDVGIDFFDVDAGFVVFTIEKAQFHAFCHIGEKRKVCSRAVISRAEGVRLTGPNLKAMFVGATHTGVFYRLAVPIVVAKPLRIISIPFSKVIWNALLAVVSFSSTSAPPGLVSRMSCNADCSFIVAPMTK